MPPRRRQRFDIATPFLIYAPPARIFDVTLRRCRLRCRFSYALLHEYAAYGDAEMIRAADVAMPPPIRDTPLLAASLTPYFIY